MDQAKAALGKMDDKGVQDLAKQAQAALGGDGKAGGDNPLAGMNMEKAKETLAGMGEKGVAEAKAALEKGDIKGAAETVMGSLGGGAGK